VDLPRLAAVHLAAVRDLASSACIFYCLLLLAGLAVSQQPADSSIHVVKLESKRRPVHELWPVVRVLPRRGNQLLLPYILRGKTF